MRGSRECRVGVDPTGRLLPGSRRRAASSDLLAEPKRNEVMATVHDWIDACRRQGITLRRRGQEHCGPCPICRTGDDRFWIKPGRVQPVLARCRHGHTYRQLHRALLGDSFDAVVRPRRRRPAGLATELADPTLSDQAHRARRLFATAHRGQPTYFRRKFPESDRLVWTHRDMWLVPLKPFADGQLLPGIAGAQFILPDGTKRFQRDLRLSGLATSPRWRAAGPLLLTEGVTSALAVALSITDPPLGVLACLSRNGLLETARRLGRRPAAVIADHDHPDENGVRPGIDAAVRTGLPWWASATEGFDAWDVWNAGETAPLVEWVRNPSNLFTTTAGPR